MMLCFIDCLFVQRWPKYNEEMYNIFVAEKQHDISQ